MCLLCAEGCGSQCGGSAGCVVHVDVHGEWAMLCVGVCSCHSEHGRYGLSCLYANTVECMSLYGMYSMYSI